MVYIQGTDGLISLVEKLTDSDTKGVLTTEIELIEVLNSPIIEPVDDSTEGKLTGIGKPDDSRKGTVKDSGGAGIDDSGQGAVSGNGETENVEESARLGVGLRIDDSGSDGTGIVDETMGTGVGEPHSTQYLFHSKFLLDID